MKTFKKFSFSIILGVFFIISCRVNLVTNYDTAIAEQIDNTSKTVDKFYLTMLETTTTQNGGRSYSKYVTEYVDIEVELNSLLNKNKVRPLNQNSSKICTITLNLWQKRKEEHKSLDSLSNGLIKGNRKDFSDLFFVMQSAEKAKSYINNPHYKTE
jgi:hypothetical protein